LRSAGEADLTGAVGSTAVAEVSTVGAGAIPAAADTPAVDIVVADLLPRQGTAARMAEAVGTRVVLMVVHRLHKVAPVEADLV
jgi:GrpB-like predicted nucleotidyltransferase (UPF0157 family)